MDKALLLADWKGFPARRERSKREGKLRGIGIATFLDASAAGVAPKDQAVRALRRVGHSARELVSQSTGQGHENRVCAHPQRRPGPGRRAIVSTRATSTSPSWATHRRLALALRRGSAVKLLVAKLIETAKPLAVAALGADAVEYRDGKFDAGSNRSALRSR